MSLDEQIAELKDLIRKKIADYMEENKISLNGDVYLWVNLCGYPYQKFLKEEIFAPVVKSFRDSGWKIEYNIADKGSEWVYCIWRNKDYVEKQKEEATSRPLTNKLKRII